jgi:hypothetical protein
MEVYTRRKGKRLEQQSEISGLVLPSLVILVALSSWSSEITNRPRLSQSGLAPSRRLDR